MNVIIRPSFWRNLCEACVIAIIAATPIIVSTVMYRGFEIGKLALAQPLAILAAGAALMTAGRQWNVRRDMPARFAACLLVAFGLFAIVSTGLADYPEAAFFGSNDRREGLLAWLAYCAFFFAVAGAADRRDGVDRFIDVMLIASVIPAVFALQQRLGFDFLPQGIRDATRSDGTLGSPVFMAAYLAALIPVTVARCCQARRSPAQFMLWSAILLAQTGALIVTQSRGPLLALLAGLVLYALCIAALVQAKRLFAGALATFALIGVLLAAINLFTPAQQWAAGLPVLSRLVFKLDLATDGQTQRASRSAQSRAVIWQAGLETYNDAPIARQLLGYGPDSAAEQYFPHVPASVIRLTSYGDERVFDRIHADAYDMSLNFGVVAWFLYTVFFGTVMYASARALWRLQGHGAPAIYAGLALGVGMLAAAAAGLSGYPAAAAPAFGLGCGAGVFLFMAGHALAALRRAGVSGTGEPAAAAWLLVALTAALWVFWMDVQINVPVPTTRLVSFALAALILVVAGRIRGGVDAEAAPAQVEDVNWRAFGMACVAVATIGSCLPDAIFDPSEDLQWLRRIAPVALLVAIASAAMRTLVRRVALDGSARFALMVAAAPPFAYLLLHVASIVRPAAQLQPRDAVAIEIASVGATAFVGLLTVMFAWRQTRSPASPQDAPLSALSKAGLALVLGATVLIAGLDWQARRAEVAYTLAVRVAMTQPGLSEQLIEEAIRERPFERYYRRQHAKRLLTYAFGGLRQLETTPPQSPMFKARLDYVMRKLAAAETAARAGTALFPRDPWMVGMLANVLQIRALRALRPLDPEASLRAAREADQMFAKAHRIFPAEPLILRNWGQFLAEQGNFEASYRVFDRMETLIPDDIAPYAGRIEAARRAGDVKVIEGTLNRAKNALQPVHFNELVAVANAQQMR